MNLTRLYRYYPELTGELNNLNHSFEKKPGFNIVLERDSNDDNTKDGAKEKSVVLDPFESRFKLLMNKYGIAEEYWIDLIYINQVILKELENEQFFFELDPETSNAIDFLIGYQELVKQEENSKKTSNNTDPFVIHVKRKSHNTGVSLNYHGSAQLIMRQIFKAFKTSFANPTLSLLLEDYKEIPSIDVLKDFNLPPEIKRNNLAKKLLQNSAEILSDYFEKYIPKKVHSRKKNLIIFELFYLFDTIRYAGSVLKVDTLSIRRRNLDIVYSLPFNESKCSEMIKELMKKGKSNTKL